MFALEAIFSSIAYIFAALTLSLLVTAGFLLPAGEPRSLRQSLVAWALTLLLAFLVVCVLCLLIQGAKIQRGEWPSADVLFRYLTRTQSGKIWLLRECYGLSLALIMFCFLKPKGSSKAVRLLALLTLPLIASRSLMSHASAVKENTAIVIAADTIHLVATALWAGGLPVLFGVLYYGTERLKMPLSWAASIVSRFSRLALASVGALILTGLYQGLIHVGDLNTLWETSYGGVLLSKLSLVFAMLGLGALNFFSTRRTLLQQAQYNGNDPFVSRKALMRIGAESFLGLLIFFVTGFLTILPPGIHARHQSLAPAATIHHYPTPKLAPAQGASVKILSPKPEEVFKGDQVPLQYKLTKGKRGEHVHAYVDGELMGMFKSERGTITGIKPGQHTLELRVVAKDHQTELDASDKVRFGVKR
ncbi:MAG TPA: CopD family protein [Candidatus Binatia bacterium]|jgi:putative copper export protein|nr:CopD family protein [Candidatus Binatia bacterium]